MFMLKPPFKLRYWRCLWDPHSLISFTRVTRRWNHLPSSFNAKPALGRWSKLRYNAKLAVYWNEVIKIILCDFVRWGSLCDITVLRPPTASCKSIACQFHKSVCFPKQYRQTAFDGSGHKNKIRTPKKRAANLTLSDRREQQQHWQERIQLRRREMARALIHCRQKSLSEIERQSCHLARLSFGPLSEAFEATDPNVRVTSFDDVHRLSPVAFCSCSLLLSRSSVALSAFTVGLLKHFVNAEFKRQKVKPPTSETEPLPQSGHHYSGKFLHLAFAMKERGHLSGETVQHLQRKNNECGSYWTKLLFFCLNLSISSMLLMAW